MPKLCTNDFLGHAGIAGVLGPSMPESVLADAVPLEDRAEPVARVWPAQVARENPCPASSPAALEDLASGWGQVNDPRTSSMASRLVLGNRDGATGHVDVSPSQFPRLARAATGFKDEPDQIKGRRELLRLGHRGEELVKLRFTQGFGPRRRLLYAGDVGGDRDPAARMPELEDGRGVEHLLSERLVTEWSVDRAAPSMGVHGLETSIATLSEICEVLMQDVAMQRRHGLPAGPGIEFFDHFERVIAVPMHAPPLDQSSDGRRRLGRRLSRSMQLGKQGVRTGLSGPAVFFPAETEAPRSIGEVGLGCSAHAINPGYVTGQKNKGPVAESTEPLDSCKVLRFGGLNSGRQDSNLRPSAPHAHLSRRVSRLCDRQLRAFPTGPIGHLGRNVPAGLARRKGPAIGPVTPTKHRAATGPEFHELVGVQRAQRVGTADRTPQIALRPFPAFAGGGVG